MVLLDPRLGEIHVFFAIQSRQLSLSELVVPRHEQPRRAFHDHERCQSQEEHRQHDREPGNVAPATTCVGEEERDSNQQVPDSNRDLEAYTEAVTETWWRDLTDEARDDRCGTPDAIPETTRPPMNIHMLEALA